MSDEKQPATDAVECPGFLSTSSGEWVKGTVNLSLEPEPDAPRSMYHLRAEFRPYETVPNDTRTMTAIVPGKAGRKLRRLATFHRDQHRIPEEMDVQDELRAMEVLAKTLDSLDEETAARVLAWLNSRAQAADLKRLGRGAQESPVRTAEESVRLAKERMRVSLQEGLGPPRVPQERLRS